MTTPRIRARLAIGFLIVALAVGYSIYNRSQSASANSKPTLVGDATLSIQDHSYSPLEFPGKSQVYAKPFDFGLAGNPLLVQTGCPTPSFAPAATSPESVGLDPHYVCVGHFNADSNPDMVITNSDDNTLSVLLGDGTGNFTETPGPRIPTGVDPITVEDGDFNGDNKSDLAITNQGAASLTILLGNGDGTFVQASGSPIAVGLAPRAVAVGSFNGDAHQDLVVCNGTSDNISILLGNGDGTFVNAAGSPFASGDAPFHAVIGNFNGDANADLAVAMLGDGAVRIYLGNGNGTFTQSGAPISVGSFTSFLALGDFNEDTFLDIAAVNRISSDMAILLGNGSGGFTQAAGSPYATGVAPMVVATADVNFDGNLDLAVANESNANTFVFLGNGNGGFGAPTTLNKGQLPTHLAIADFNGDNRPDIATSDAGDAAVTILLNTCLACLPITVNPATISPATAGASYSQTFTATGGTAPYTFNLTGALPLGLTFSGDTLSGTPTQTGSFPITVTASDASSCTGSRNYTLVVNCQTITVNPATIPAGTVGTGYSQTFTHSGGLGTVTFGLTGALPTGLSFAGDTLSGTPTQSGSFPITVTATDSNNCTGSSNYTLVINCQTITVNPATISAGTAGTAYSESFTHSGGLGTVGFSLTGTLPTGMSFAGATLSGTPTQTGSFPITVTATDSNGCTGSRNYTLVINCQTITVNPATIPTGTVSSVYSQTFTHSGGIGTVGFGLTGTLPTGITFSGATLSGTPTQTGSFPITVTATDANGCTGSRNYTLVINCQTYSVTPATIPAGTVGTAYSQTFGHSGGIGTVGFGLTGALPTGMSFAGATLSGTPTQTGSFPISITATDANGCTATRNYTLVINCQTITVNPATIPSGTVNAAYSQTFTHSGGIGTVGFGLTGTLPTGITFSGATLSGTPTQSGSFPIIVTATDANGCTGSRNYTLVINCQTITVNPATIPAGTASSVYSQTFTHSGGIGTVGFGLTGTLPTGMSFAGATLSGTPTQTGSFPITVTATDANGCTGSRNYTLVINCQTYSVTPATIPAGTVGTGYSQTFGHSGGIGTVTFSQLGQLPVGITFSGGALSGTPTQTGSFPISITATDANGCTATRNYTLVINCQAITVNPATIPAGTVNAVYSQTFTQTGGVGTVTFSRTGTLPTGLTFSGATLSGTPTQSGSFPITITATDSNGCTGSRNYTLVINCQTISILPATIPAGTAGTAYSQTFTSSGGVGTVTFGQSGKLPAGITFSGATLSGTPTQTGTYPISITATDANNCSSTRNYTLVINCPTITVNPATIPAGTAGTAYSQTFTRTGGIAPVGFSLTGTLPNGLTFSGATLSGTPTQIGNFPITVTATDANGCTGSRNYTLVINCQTITVNPATIAAGVVNTAYSQTFTQSGGIGTVSFSLTGALPSGLSFAGATLSGTPTQTGTFPITVKATDANGCMGNRNYTLVVNCQGFTVNPATIPAGTLGVAYNQTFTSTGGTGAVTFSLAGTLPTGITFSGATLSGTPSQPGSFPITVTATDSNSCVSSRNYTLVINCQTITVSPATIPSGVAGTAYSQSFTQNGGVGSTGFSLTGALPTGMSFAGATLSGTPTQTGSFPITVTATDSNGCTGTRNYTLVINCQPITVNPATIPAGTAGTAYSQGFTQIGGIGSTGFSLTGALPTGMSFAGATLSGTPTQTGNFPITVTATDANGCTGSRNYTLVINCPGITVNPASLPNGFVGASYGTQTLSATGGIGSYAFTVSAGALPNGVTLSGSALSGTPTATGTFNFTIQATDSNGCTGTRSYTVIISGGGGGLQFYPLASPVRLLDTRQGGQGCFTPNAPLGNDAVRLQQATGGCSGIPANAKAIVGNATVVNFISTGSHWITLYPSDASQPNASNLNFSDNQIIPNQFTVGLGADGAFNIYSHASTHFIVDVTGYYAPPAAGGLYFHPLPAPVRMFDSRTGQTACDAPGTPLANDGTRAVTAHGICSGATIPAAAKAIVGNATVVNFISTGSHWITLYPFGTSQPNASNLNFGANQIIPNAFVVGLSNDGKFNIYSHAATDFIVDVNGYLSTEAVDVNGTGLLYNPLPAPVRILDTRTGGSACDTPNTPLGNDATRTQTATGTCSGIPATAKAVVGNGTVVNFISTGFHWITLYPFGASQPNASNLNFSANQIIPNAFVVGLGNDGKFNIYSHASTHFIVDLTGYFAP